MRFWIPSRVRRMIASLVFLIREALCLVVAIILYLRGRLFSKSVAWPYKTVYIDPKEIKGKIRRKRERERWPLGAVVDGDWDSDLRKIQDTKYQGVFQRYVDGLPWPDTILFQSRYARVLRMNGRPHGCGTTEELVRRYEEHMDAVFKSIQTHGFRKARLFSRKIEPIYVHIARDGKIVSYNGNHRLYMAMVLGLDKVPVRVWARHRGWQEIREKVAAGKPLDETTEDSIGSHPDLQDLRLRKGMRIGEWAVRGFLVMVLITEIYDA